MARIIQVARQAIALIALAILLWSYSALGARADSESTKSLTRNLEAVIVPGRVITGFLGLPTDHLFVYAEHANRWRQLPFQIDQVSEHGNYVSPGSGILGADDEIVFMAIDLGDKGSLPALAASIPISSSGYQIEVSDSLSPTLKGRAYLVASPHLTRSFTETYALFDEQTERVVTPDYTLGFIKEHPGIDYLALYGSGIDILDRTKIRVQSVMGQRTEEDLDPTPIELIKNGPVRVIAWDGAFLGYRSLIEMEIEYRLPAGVTIARLSTDFSSEIVTATFYNANTAEGILIDGLPDTVRPAPVSSWWQVSGSTGTLVQVTDLSQIDGILSNYYKDDATIDPNDKGDRKSYGDSGIKAVNPNANVLYRSAYLLLPPQQPNVGETYAAYWLHPLLVEAMTQSASFHMALPLIIKGSQDRNILTK